MFAIFLRNLFKNFRKVFPPKIIPATPMGLIIKALFTNFLFIRFYRTISDMSEKMRAKMRAKMREKMF